MSVIKYRNSLDDAWQTLEVIRGEAGPQGPAGPEGHTPVKGVDYWTTEDQQAIVTAVLNSLPNAEGATY